MLEPANTYQNGTFKIHARFVIGTLAVWMYVAAPSSAANYTNIEVQTSDWAAIEYIPRGSQAYMKVKRRIGYCGTGIARYLNQNGDEFNEAELVARARQLQFEFARTEAITGPFADEGLCITENCNGTVRFEEISEMSQGRIMTEWANRAGCSPSALVGQIEVIA